MVIQKWICQKKNFLSILLFKIKKLKSKFKNFILIATLFPRYNNAGIHPKNHEFVFFNNQKKKY